MDEQLSFLPEIINDLNTSIFTVKGDTFVYFGKVKKFFKIEVSPSGYLMQIPILAEQGPYVLSSIVNSKQLKKIVSTFLKMSKRVIPGTTMMDLNKPWSITRLYLNVSLDCNLRCKYCYVADGREFMLATMPLTVATEAVDWLVTRKNHMLPLQIRFFGGEPLLNMPVIRQTILYCEKLKGKNNIKFEYFLSTNGTLIDEEVALFLKQYNVHVKISIDGPESVHNRNRKYADGNGSYEATVRGIRTIQKCGVLPTACVTLEQLTAAQIKMSLEELRSMGIENVQWQAAVLDSGVSAGDEAHELEALACQCWEGVLSGYDGYLSLFAPGFKKMADPEPVFPGCGAGINSLMVSPNADLYLCQRFLGQHDFVAGNIRKGCLNNKLKKIIFESIEAQLENCRNCWLVYLCSKGCFYANYFKRGDPGSVDGKACLDTAAYYRYAVWLLFQLTLKQPQKLQGLLQHRTYMDVEHE